MSGRKVAIVTGGASGIGKAICNELVSRNVFVVITDINEKNGKCTEDELNKDGVNAKFICLDVTNEKMVRSVYSEIYSEFNRIDYIFNNAGFAMYGELYDMSIEHWEDIVDVNVWGVIYGTQFGYQLMKKQGWGYIVNTASAAGLGPSPLSAAYATTKHAVIGLTTSLHYEAENYGINVSTLCPAFVRTSAFDNAKAIKMDKRMMTNQLKKQKMMSPEKLATVAIDGVHKNKPIICPLPMRRTIDIMFLLFPVAHRLLMRLVCKVGREAKVTT
ncbi:SDR family NAD(P)-dependent oxidoreductase [Bacillus sp. SCS-151]|uniref:SDR family NAD(P)-dependent oxidoreductase n=1 Tax=Nanhaiella sioensis TaxID=3115293 RepID=UPI003979D589